MASISTDKQTGLRKILFFNRDGERKVVRLGKGATLRDALAAQSKIEHLVACTIHRRAPDAETCRWVADQPDKLAARLAKLGLIAAREAVASSTLSAFVDAYIAGRRADVKASTATVYGHTRRCLVEHFGADKPLEDITPGDVANWRRWLARPKIKDKPDESGQGLSTNTVRRRCGIAKQFFAAAVDHELIARNPFARMRDTTVKANKGRDHFITRDDASTVLDACPDAQWRLLFALSRYGGLRCPSEHLALRWGDVDWERGRIVVTSPKTAHHEGKGERIVPLFPELRPYLEKVFDEAEPCSEFVITRYRKRNANLRTQLDRIIKRAGLRPWPKRFQNLRSTRETELADKFPMHVVCAWLGNSERVAQKHYLQVTDAHFEAAQKAAQYPSAASCNTSQPKESTSTISEKRDRSSVFVGCKVGDTRLELVTSTV